MTEATERCPENVYSSDGWARAHSCGKPVKRNGKCGIHARADEQRTARHAKWENDEAERKANVEAGRRIARDLEFFITDWKAIEVNFYNGKLTLTQEQALQILSMLKSGARARITLRQTPPRALRANPDLTLPGPDPDGGIDLTDEEAESFLEAVERQ